MSIKRRHFLILGSLSSLGFAGIWKMFQLRTSWGTDTDAAVASNVEAERAIVPLPASPPILRFISVADTGTGAEGQYAVAEAMAQYHRENPFNVAVLAGDNIYNNGEFEKINAVFEQPY
ncbi:MAG TPA: metallophosphoesterase, partial [Phormidium sp.]